MEKAVINNTIITVFRSVPENITGSLRTYRACSVGAMTEGNIPGTDQKTPRRRRTQIERT